MTRVMISVYGMVEVCTLLSAVLIVIYFCCVHSIFAFNALTLLLGSRKGIRPVKNGRWWRWSLVSPDGVSPSRMIGVSASVNLRLHHKVQNFWHRLIRVVQEKGP